MSAAPEVSATAEVSAAPEVIARLHAVLDEIAAADVSSWSDDELVSAATELERAHHRVPAVGSRALVEISDRDIPRRRGFRSVIAFFSHALRITEPVRRKRLLEHTARFHSATGQLLAPSCPTLAEKCADGSAGMSHALVVLDVLDKIPAATPHDVRVAAEQTMSHYAGTLSPPELGQVGARLLAHLDPDGQLTDDTDRARRRNLWLNRQDTQLMSKLNGHLDPQTRAMFDVVLDAWGKPGLNNPDDDASPRGPVGDADPRQLADAAGRDNRSQAQRNHDALHALLRAVLAEGTLGKSHRGLPAHVIIKIDEKDLRRHAGLGTTASGAVLPISDVITMAARSQQYLAVFADHTAVPLYFGRSRRLASLGQRLASFASDGGEMCSAPDCTQPATRVEIHHARNDWANGGLTDIDSLKPACPKHNPMVGPNPGQYTTRIIDDGPDTGRVAWQLNTHPGMPPNPEHINRHPDIGTVFADTLDAVRADIHGPRPEQHSPPDDPPTTPDEGLPDEFTPAHESDIESDIESTLESMLYHQLIAHISTHSHVTYTHTPDGTDIVRLHHTG
ncbi:DUF222 domain-containing protein [Gordonia sp. NPDC003429]